MLSLLTDQESARDSGAVVQDAFDVVELQPLVERGQDGVDRDAVGHGRVVIQGQLENLVLAHIVGIPAVAVRCDCQKKRGYIPLMPAADVKMEIPVLGLSLLSRILSSTSFQMDKTFWGMANAAVEQSRR